MIGDSDSSVTDYIEEVMVGVLSLSAPPCAEGSVRRSRVTITGSERVQLFQEPVIWVDLRPMYSERAGLG